MLPWPDPGPKINSEISLRSARETIDISPAGRRILSAFAIEGLRPAMIWEGSGPGFIPGLKVAVFLGDVDGDPAPGDLPAIVLADPRLVLEIGSGELTVGDLAGHGPEVRSKLDLPSNGHLQLQGTLRFLYDLHGATNSLDSKSTNLTRNTASNLTAIEEVNVTGIEKSDY